jgi:hypothetical protein
MPPVTDDLSLSNWIAHIFDHPVPEQRGDAWHWSLDAPYWNDSPEHTCELIAETFERSGELLARFSDAQLNQGFWYLVSNSCSDQMFSLIEPAVPMPIRLRALRSFVPLFEQIMAVRCSPHLSHLDEPGANPLNAVCYMWWDILPIYGRPDEPDRAQFDPEVLAVLRRLLTIPNDACRESAFHGLGHWELEYPRQVAGIIDDFLRRSPDLRPELIDYAERAKKGYIQ